MPAFRNVDQAGVLGRSGAEVRADYLDLPDAALMVAVGHRDVQAFAALYERYADLVLSTALRVLGDEGLAEDVAQDVFVRIWRRPEAFVAERGRFMSWVVSVTRNRAVDELRARSRRRKREVFTVGNPGDEGSMAEVPDEGIGTARSVEIHESQADVRDALTEIPVAQRQALELAYFGGMTQQEIALHLHEPLGTVKTRIRLGMKKLREALEGKQ